MKLKKIILKYCLFSFVLLFFLFGGFIPLKARATGMGSIPASDFTALTSIQTTDSGNIWADLSNTAENIGLWAKEWAKEEWDWLRDQGAALAYRKALDYFLQQLAYDTATYLATGDKGQGAMFYTESWGDYLSNVADNAAGHFLEELGSGGPIKFDLCNPGADITMRIGLGIMQSRNPSEPDCTYSEMKNNWEAELQRSDFLNRFGNMFEPQSNDFGISLALHAEVMQREVAEKEVAVLNREVNDGFKDVTESVSEAIKTPGTAVRNAMIDAQNKSGAGIFTNTGFALADAIDVFTNTLVSKLMQEWLRKGIARSYDNTSYTGNWGGYSSGNRSSYYSSSGSSYSSGASSNSRSSYSGSGGLTAYDADIKVGAGINEAKEQFRAIVEPNFSIKGDYEALNELAACGNPTNAKTNECVITENFRQAIENRMTIAEAMNKKYLSKDGIFGFRADGLEPNFNEGIPYRSMIIMRKYRIIPVGWELAAQYIMDHQNSLHRSLSLYDMIACFDPSNSVDDRYHGYQGLPGNPWCEGLVDPSWVLKSPQNFCKREGAGPYIVSSHVFGEGERSKLSISRDNNYCADEQTCIKENDDGSCDLYGYCTEDRRKYNFEGESCDPIYNTCESFRVQDGRTIALLENTLDYGSSAAPCTSENAGCRHYQQAIDPLIDGGALYDDDQDKVTWRGVSGNIKLDYSATECEANAEGCHEFIRTKPGLGANLLTNPGFEEYNAGVFLDWGPIGSVVSDSIDGFQAVRLTNDFSRNVVIDPYDISVGGSNFDLNGSMFTLSLYVKDCNPAASIQIASTSVSMEAVNWKLISLSHIYDSPSGNILTIQTSGAANCVIDSVKLERSTPDNNGKPTRFTSYREASLVYQKLIPAYLYDACYGPADANGFIEARSDAPKICNEYLRYCTASEVNCDFYKSLTDGFYVPGVVAAEDYCPEQCVGYDEYSQTESNFEDRETEYFIPDTAKSCSALSAGCDEFTNLDEMDNPEAREYFVHMRRCINPDDPVAACQAFFMWEGSDETGYQLRVHQLNTDGTGPIGIERSNGTVSGCSTDITNINYDPDCREFYDSLGNVDYELFYNTVSCTDNCHPYRRTVLDSLAVETANCIYGGGTMQSGACIYMGVPSEGVVCQAENAGCREYNGNSGANTRVIFEHTFEDGTNQNWNNGVNSSLSVIVGEHSLQISNPASLILGGDLQEGKSYVLQFLAVGAGINSISFNNSSGDIAIFDGSNIPPAASWAFYEVNLDILNHSIDPVNEELVFNVAGGVYIDNIRLTEVADRYYLIEDSWVDYCDHENADPDEPLWPDEGHYASCDAYADRDDIVHNLFQFSHLCSNSAVGCELMIDTHNYSDYRGGVWYDDNNNGVCDAGENDCVEVPADNYIYVVYNSDKTCEQQNKGCERLGLEYIYEYPSIDYYQYFDNYKLNNPDIYTESLCQDETVLCDAWESKDGNSYFKDPVDMICEWRVEEGLGAGRWNWLKKKVKRCDVNNNGIIDLAASGLEPINSELRLCSNASDCELDLAIGTPDWCGSDKDCLDSVCIDNKCHDACIMDEADYLCDKDNNGVIPPKTIGYGGSGNKIEQPLGDLESSNWSAVCPAGQGGCTEYIEPESDFSFDVDTLKPYSLYIADSAVPACANGNSYVLNNALNQLVFANPVFGDIFYYANDTECRFDAGAYSIRQAIVDYQLEQSLNKTTCNGIVDLEQGCVLFNERSREGIIGMLALGYDADTTPPNYQIPSAPISASPGNANVLLKVTPDRTCNSWLSCRSFIKDADGNDVCYDVGLCEKLDVNGNCSYFSPLIGAVNQTYNVNIGLDDISNMTGYSKVGYGNNSLESDYYPIGEMAQVGQLAKVPNGSFELYDANMYPLGWTSANNSGNVDWERDMFKVINNPVSSQIEGIRYPLDGKAFLKFGARDQVRSEPIALAQNQEYTLTFYINTKNLASGNAVFSALSMGTLTSGGPLSRNIERSQDWKMYLFHFRASGNPNARISFRANNSDGNVYVDKIEIKPSLNSRQNFGSEWYTPQTCRLYPKSNSLSCDYYDDSGHKEKGWPGYCLEYDRYPGNPEACLMWYPVDRVNGDGVEEGGGYIDRRPLYYCVDTADYIYGTPFYNNPDGIPSETEVLVSDNNFGAQSSGDIDITHRNPDGWSEDEWTLDQLGLGHVDERWLLWENIDHIRIHEMSPSSYCGEKLEPSWDLYFRFDENNLGADCPLGLPTSVDCQPWGVTCTDASAGCADGGLLILSSDDGLSFDGLRTTNWDGDCNHPDYQILEVAIFPKVFYCSDVIQTVTPMGQNRFYSSHVYEGSNESYACNNGINYAEYNICSYMADLAPFGAVAQPGLEIDDWAVMSNPYMWDSREGIENNQPLFFEIPNDSMFNNSQARMGQLLGENTVLSNLFGKYYGRWTFHSDGAGISQIMGHYEINGGTREVGGGRAPIIGNISTVPISGSIYVNQLVNLRFTTDVDENHLPMTMYVVDWGDGTVTAVSGIEMRDRPEINNPHSMYHIYSTAGTHHGSIRIRDNWRMESVLPLTIIVRN